MIRRAATFAVVTVALTLASPALVTVVGSGCGSSSDCACEQLTTESAHVSVDCWCETNDCGLDADAAGAMLCKNLAKGTWVRRQDGCGQISLGTFGMNDRAPTGREHFLFDEATGKRVGGLVWGDRPAGPCNKTNYVYGVPTTICPQLTQTSLCANP